MKTIIFIIVLCLATPVKAAVPTFSSFNTNQFLAVAPTVVIKDGALTTNLLVSGYLNLGNTNQYADNGSDLTRNGVAVGAGGGGDTIWTNISGTIQPLSGQATNQLSFTSESSAGSGDVALIIDTTTDWVEASNIIEGRSAGITVFQVDGLGSLMLGPNTESAWGPIDADDGIIQIHDVAAGDDPVLNVNFSSVTDVNVYADLSEFFLTVTDTSLNLNLITIENNQASGTVISSANSQSSIVQKVDDVERLAFVPSTASTGSATAHFLDTFNVLTNGDSLFQVRNAGVNRVKVQHDGTLSIQNTTNRLGVSAGVLQLDGVNIGGSSATIITTNNFEYNGNVTYKNAVYVTNTTIYINGVDVRGDARLLACSDLTTAITVSTNKAYWYAPYALTVTRVKATLNIAQDSGSTFTVDINEAGTSILSTKLTVDNAENTSDTAAAAPVISDAAIANNARVTIDVDQIGNGTAAGLIVEVYFTPQ